jgi:drug/metabolite transporter (DMT)-like permease
MDTVAGGAAALLSAAIWAYSATAITAPARRWGGRATNLFKSVVASGLFLVTVLAWLGPSAFGFPAPVWWRFVLSGLLGLAIADTAYLSALKHIGPTLTAIVYQTSGIFTCFLGLLFLDEHLSFREVGAIGLVIGGVLVAILDDPPGRVEPGHRLRGLLYGLLAAAFHSCGLIANKDAFQELAAFDGTEGMRAAMVAGFARMTACSLALLLFGALTGSLKRQTSVLRDPEGWKASFVPAVLGSFVAMATMQFSLTILKTGISSVLLSMTPIFTIPVAWWLLQHRPSWRAIAGAMIALAGAWMLADPEAPG